MSPAWKYVNRWRQCLHIEFLKYIQPYRFASHSIFVAISLDFWIWDPFWGLGTGDWGAYILCVHKRASAAGPGRALIEWININSDYKFATSGSDGFRNYKNQTENRIERRQSGGHLIAFFARDRRSSNQLHRPLPEQCPVASIDYQFVPYICMYMRIYTGAEPSVLWH